MKDSSPTVKICTKCGEGKPISEYKNILIKARIDGTRKPAQRSSCKACDNKTTQDWLKRQDEYKKKWRAKNPEKIRQENLRAKSRTDKWREDNKEELKIRKSEYRKRPESKQKKNAWSRADGRKKISELSDTYVIQKIRRGTGIKCETIRQYPELIETKRLIIQTKRLCKTSSN